MPNSDMVGVSIVAIRRKCHDHMRFDAADVCNDPGYGLSMICLVHIAIAVIKKIESAHAKNSSGVLQLFCAELAESAGARVLLFGTEPAELAA